ncbi:MAG: cupin domain-containing protein [Acidimicrobiales bacterium]
MAGTITTLEASDNHHVLGESLRPLLTNAMGSSIEVFDTSGPAGGGPPAHQHPWEEIYVVLDGELEVTVDGETHVLTKGGAAHIPGGIAHGYRNLTDCHFLTIVSKGNASKMFAQFAGEVEMDPPDIPGLIRVAGENGATFL